MSVPEVLVVVATPAATYRAPLSVPVSVDTAC